MRNYLYFCFVLILFVIFNIKSYSGPQPLVRYYNVYSGDHFYTLGGLEIGYEKKYGYNCEGAIGWLYPQSVPNSIPLYRYWNGQEHFYTTNAGEIGVTQHGQRGRYNYVSEGITGYVFGYQAPNTVPLYRYFNGKEHFYTTNAGEIGTVTPGQRGAYNYVSEGICCYILPLQLPKRDVTDSTLWSKYRDHLIENLSKNFCGGSLTCGKMAGTGFQMTVNPVYARWNNDANDLNNQMCYAPKYSTNWEFKAISYDGEFQNLYKKFLFSIPDQNEAKSAFVKLSSFGSSYSQNCYSWQETGYKLKDWLNQARATPANHVGFQFHFDIDFATSQKNDWTRFGTAEARNYFIRTEKQSPMNDNGILSKNMPTSDSQQTVHTFQDGIQLLHSNRFDLTFTSRAVGVIPITPSSQWFDANLSLKYRHLLRNYIPFVPTYVFVALSPKITMTVSKSIYDEIQNKMNQGGFLSWFIGGVKFDNPNARLSDSNLFPNVEKNNLNLEELINNKKLKKKDSFEKNLEEYLDSFIFEKKLLSDFLFRRRRRNPVVVEHKNIIPQVEGEYSVEFTAKDNEAQILGVVSIIA